MQRESLVDVVSMRLITIDKHILELKRNENKRTKYIRIYNRT